MKSFRSLLRFRARGGAAVLVLALLGLLIIPSASIPQAQQKVVTLSFTDAPGNPLGRTNGWFRQRVVVHWQVAPARGLVQTVGCEPASWVNVQTSGRAFRCEALWSDGTRVRRAVAPPVRVDWTPPRSIRVTPGRRPDLYGWYGSDIRFRVSGSDTLSGILRCPTRVYRGPNSARARVRGTCVDRAGNRASRFFVFKYQEPLLSPRSGRRAWRPLLNWVSVPRARYYNVQVWKNGRAILNRWPRYSQLRMPRTWVHEGLRYWMSTPGRYDWYVWPRFYGRYGRMVGHRYFIRP
jgi:hypothetical protein